ncbi:hypothetical protein AB4367_13315 [Vibrio breoganii]|uniref:hypothetical protein n=1 Tax=Vibrio breoganii TaxID=553239 RepID=UPI0012FFF641|nr:hypothetical protein [Vibrio breoganii]
MQLNDKKPIQIRVDKELHERIQKEASECGQTMAGWLKMLAVRELRNIENESK